MKHMKWMTAALAVSLGSSAMAADLPGKGVEVQAVQSTISEETFQTMIVDKALAELGYTVDPIKEVDYSAGYTAIASGDAQFMTVNWDPLHNQMYKNAGGDEAFYRAGKYITGAAQGYLIDKKTADKYHITSLEDFKKPEIAKLFDVDGDGKADLTACQAGWGCEAVINYQMDAYKLHDTVTAHWGQYAAIIADTISRYEAGQPVFYYTWTPYWVSGKLVPGKDVVWLQVPFSANPNGVDTELPNGKNYGFQVNSERIVANKEWAKANPAAAKLFAIMRLPIKAVSAENMMLQKGSSSQKAIEQHADAWIKANRKTFDHWIAEAKAAAK